MAALVEQAPAIPGRAAPTARVARAGTRVAEVVGTDGVRLHVRESGPADAPAIVLVHGCGQDWRGWQGQLRSPSLEAWRLVAFDLRGHGMSDRPATQGAYAARRLADDLAAVVAQLELERPLLAGWASGAQIICDYLRTYGDGAVRGCNLVSWSVTPDHEPRAISPSRPDLREPFPGTDSGDLATRLAAMTAFLGMAPSRPLARADRDALLAAGVDLPPLVRRAMGARRRSGDTALLQSLRIPVLASQGTSDPITSRAASAYVVRHCLTARESVYEGVGHLPQLEATERFNRELADLAGVVLGDR